MTMREVLVMVAMQWKPLCQFHSHPQPCDCIGDHVRAVLGKPLAAPSDNEKARSLAAVLRARLRKATKGPWHVIQPAQSQYRCVAFDHENYDTSPLLPADARLIVWLRNHADDIIAALEASALDRLRQALEAIAQTHDGRARQIALAALAEPRTDVPQSGDAVGRAGCPPEARG